MDSITQECRFRQAVIRYSYKYGIKETIIMYGISRATIYRWRKKVRWYVEIFREQIA